MFRIFHYPAGQGERWGVAEHTDYGLLTLLAQDASGGLQVKSGDQWLDAPPIEGTLVCNIGDMLDRLTGGWYRSTPHRVRNASGRGRLAEMQALPTIASRQPMGSGAARWDEADLQAFEGSYGDYLIAKVSKVFPELAGDQRVRASKTMT